MSTDDNGALYFFAGAIVGAAAGAIAGLLLAPRSGAETRELVTERTNEVIDSGIDAYHRGLETVQGRVDSIKPVVDAKSDELREKVDLARERMDQLRDSLSENISQVSDSLIDHEEYAVAAAGIHAKEALETASDSDVDNVSDDESIDDAVESVDEGK